MAQRHSDAGYTIDSLGGLLLMLAMMPMFIQLGELGFDWVRKRNAADHLALVSKAGAAYTRLHYEELSSQAGPAGGPSTDVAALIAEEFLPPGFQDRNVWGQSYRIYFRRPTGDRLQTIVLTTGGRGDDPRDRSFANVLVPSAASLLGGSGSSGGYVPTGMLPGQAPGTLHGAFGGWTLDLGAMGIPSPGAGHLGAFVNFDDSSMAQDFLYRVAVPGQPELNAMRTELDMTDHAIRGIHEVQFTPRELTSETCAADDEGRVFLDFNQGLYLCRAGRMEVVADTGNAALLKSAALAVDGQMIAKPVCPAGTDTTPRIYVAPALAAAGYEAPPMTALQAWAVDAGAAEWQVFLRLLTTDEALGANGDGWVHPAPDYGRITVFTTCDRDRTPVVTP